MHILCGRKPSLREWFATEILTTDNKQFIITHHFGNAELAEMKGNP